MNKAELIAAIADSSGLSKNEAEKILAGVQEGISTTLKNGGSVSLVGFGSFGVKERAAREGRNPKTNEKMLLAATTVPYFSVGKKLKEKVNSEATE
jgi:DNA-binding protein HU-beta